MGLHPLLFILTTQLYYFLSQMDNRGNRLIVAEKECDLNVPAVGAALAIKRYVAAAPDELSFEVKLFR